MTPDEQVLIGLLRIATDINIRAILLQSFIQSNGPLSEEAGKQVRELLR